MDTKGGTWACSREYRFEYRSAASGDSLSRITIVSPLSTSRTVHRLLMSSLICSTSLTASPSSSSLIISFISGDNFTVPTIVYKLPMSERHFHHRPDLGGSVQLTGRARLVFCSEPFACVVIQSAPYRIALNCLVGSSLLSTVDDIENRVARKGKVTDVRHTLITISNVE
jgi:hypothetical protein